MAQDWHLCTACRRSLEQLRAARATGCAELHSLLCATARRSRQSAAAQALDSDLLRHIGEFLVGPIGAARRHEVVCLASHSFIATPNAAVREEGVAGWPGRVPMPGQDREAFIEDLCRIILNHQVVRGFTLNEPAPALNLEPPMYAIMKRSTAHSPRHPLLGKTFFAKRASAISWSVPWPLRVRVDGAAVDG